MKAYQQVLIMFAALCIFPFAILFRLLFKKRTGEDFRLA